ncbi:MAG: DUF721 domain-containing protein [Bdellovibrionales bacterium]|nr:DUF721 domain-containing protein [Bdellovibrionales bacterium]
MSSDKKRSRLLPAANVLQALLSNGKSPLSEQFTRWKLWRNWEEIVGPSIGKNSQPVGFSKGRLYVWVSSSARMQEMRFLVGKIKDKINAHLGCEYVKFIQFTLDRKSVPSLEESEEGLRDFLSKSPPSGDEEPPRDR